ncbi:twin-arginine translocase subunit TatC [Pontibacillus litoralis]|uniref:Sec-independent protein translocase protein TatC n=1 Tax=Pontibacillus litoralis JSM 072002 TaxID=1385512 RepID=A0A0A5HW93_9BACI|nr:twin-arginine translocase subunit TatC [Pontibacillus litoralis]KGX87902.1 preprotein translocase subunit TatC [Pontibacillus litoralis JSM 072002]
MSKEQNNDQEMQVTEHLEELRSRIIWTIAAFVLFFILGFVFVEEIYNYFVSNVGYELTVLGPFDILWIYITLATFVGIIGTLPVMTLQIWLFVKPALSSKEQKVTLSYIPAMFFLFIGGLAFGYFLIEPLIFHFLVNLGEGMFETMFTVEKYFRFLIRVTLPFAVFFEIPVFVMFLTSLGIVHPNFLKKSRKYAYFILVIIGTMISPPDFILQLVVAAPLIILYEIAITCSVIVQRKRDKKMEQFYQSEEGK